MIIHARLAFDEARYAYTGNADKPYGEYQRPSNGGYANPISD